MAKLYLDTNIFVRAGWPHISGGLITLFQLAKDLGVTAVMPSAVELELEQRWIKEVTVDLENIKKGVEKIQRRTAAMALDLGNFKLPSTPSLNDLRTKHQNYVQELRQKWQIQTAPLTNRKTDELFQLALLPSPPFTEEGKGFKDMVIFLSIIDHLKQTGTTKGAFVTADKVFEIPAVKQLLDDAGVQVDFYKSPEEVIVVLERGLEVRVKAAWQKDRKQAAKALGRILPTIEEFVTKTLEVSHWDLLGWSDFRETLTAVPKIKINGIVEGSVQTTVPNQRLPGEDVRISFEVEAEIHAITLRKEYNAGATPGLFVLGVDVPGVTREIQKKEILSRIIKLEADSQVVVGQYQDINLLTPRLIPTMSPREYAFKRQVAEGSIHTPGLFRALNVGEEEQRRV